MENINITMLNHMTKKVEDSYISFKNLHKAVDICILNMASLSPQEKEDYQKLVTKFYQARDSFELAKISLKYYLDNFKA